MYLDGGAFRGVHLTNECAFRNTLDHARSTPPLEMSLHVRECARAPLIWSVRACINRVTARPRVVEYTVVRVFLCDICHICTTHAMHTQ